MANSYISSSLFRSPSPVLPRLDEQPCPVTGCERCVTELNVVDHLQSVHKVETLDMERDDDVDQGYDLILHIPRQKLEGYYNTLLTIININKNYIFTLQCHYGRNRGKSAG